MTNKKNDYQVENDQEAGGVFESGGDRSRDDKGEGESAFLALLLIMIGIGAVMLVGGVR